MGEIRYEDIPHSVFEGMEEVRKGGKYNMFERQNVFNELFQLGFYEAVEWLLDPKWEEGSYRTQCDGKKYAAVLKHWNTPEKTIIELIGE